MERQIRKAFEEVTCANFSMSQIPKNRAGEYMNPILTEHWQTFREGWEAAVDFLKNKQNSEYSDIISDGGKDPR